MNADTKWPDLAGRLDGRRHVLPVRVYYEDTDAGALVYHASYIRWFERGRSDLLRLLGLHQNALLSQDGAAGAMFFVVRRMTVDYLRPGRLDDLLEVVTEPLSVGGASLTLRQQVCRGDAVICKAEVVCVLINLEGKPLRIRTVLPAGIVQIFDAGQAGVEGR